MTAKISKWGNSQGLRVPKDVMESLNLHIGDKVNITVLEGKVIIEPIENNIPDYDLNELVSNVKANYKANEEFDNSLDKEKW